MNHLSLKLALSWRLFILSVGAKYRKSFLGYFWMIGPAVIISLALSLAGKSGVINSGEINLPYPLFVFLGTMLWQVFTESLDIAYQACQGARSYLTKVYFEREAIVLSQLYETLVSSLVRFASCLIFIFFFGKISMEGSAIIAASFACSIALGLGIGLLLLPLLLLFADTYNILRLFTSYGLFLTSAFYAPNPNATGIFNSIIQHNPLSYIMAAAREGAANTPLDNLPALAFISGVALLTIIGGRALLNLSIPIIIERMLLGGR